MNCSTKLRFCSRTGWLASRRISEGMTASAPSSAMEARKRSESSPLSASRFSTEKPLIRPSAWQISAAWPAARTKRTGLRRAPAAMLILALRPPRERPIASPSLPFFGHRPHIGAPAQWWNRNQVFKIRIFAQLCEKPLPDALFFAHRRNRLNTLFHLPNSSGRSRHGAPARTNLTRHQRTDDCLRRAAPVVFLARNKWLNPSPLPVRQYPPNQDRPPQLRS
jgi:hypothetical protein